MNLPITHLQDQYEIDVLQQRVQTSTINNSIDEPTAQLIIEGSSIVM